MPEDLLEICSKFSMNVGGLQLPLCNRGCAVYCSASSNNLIRKLFISSNTGGDFSPPGTSLNT